jgi:hypothetical protein
VNSVEILRPELRERQRLTSTFEKERQHPQAERISNDLPVEHPVK